MFKLDDIVALAKAGYKVSDVKELIELSKASEVSTGEPSSKQNETSNPSTNLVQSQTLVSEQSNIAEDTTIYKQATEDPDVKSKEAEIIDYKKKTEELEAKIESLQKANTRQNIADTDEKSDFDLFAETMKSFM